MTELVGVVFALDGATTSGAQSQSQCVIIDFYIWFPYYGVVKKADCEPLKYSAKSRGCSSRPLLCSVQLFWTAPRRPNKRRVCLFARFDCFKYQTKRLKLTFFCCYNIIVRQNQEVTRGMSNCTVFGTGGVLNAGDRRKNSVSPLG